MSKFNPISKLINAFRPSNNQVIDNSSDWSQNSQSNMNKYPYIPDQAGAYLKSLPSSNHNHIDFSLLNDNSKAVFQSNNYPEQSDSKSRNNNTSQRSKNQSMKKLSIQNSRNSQQSQIQENSLIIPYQSHNFDQYPKHQLMNSRMNVPRALNSNSQSQPNQVNEKNSPWQNQNQIPIQKNWSSFMSANIAVFQYKF